MTQEAHVIGDPIAQSKSPQIHGFWLGKLGISATYSAKQISLADLKPYLQNYSDNPEWVGCNVTMPHKEAIAAHLDLIDQNARRIGAINTVYLTREGKLAGMNTDGAGFLEPLRRQLNAKHLYRMARILGTGGAARAIIVALADLGFTLVVAGRNPSKARALLDELAPGDGHHAVDLTHFAEPTDFEFDDRQGCLDLVINASPLGMSGHPPLAFHWSHAPPGSIAYDIVTRPVDTRFLRDARDAGHTTIHGLAMLVGQAAIAFEAFFGVAPPREHDDELMDLLVK